MMISTGINSNKPEPYYIGKLTQPKWSIDHLWVINENQFLHCGIIRNPCSSYFMLWFQLGFELKIPLLTWTILDVCPNQPRVQLLCPNRKHPPPLPFDNLQAENALKFLNANVNYLLLTFVS